MRLGLRINMISALDVKSGILQLRTANYRRVIVKLKIINLQKNDN